MDHTADDKLLVRLLEEMDNMARGLVASSGGYVPFGGTIDDQGQVELLTHPSAYTGGATAETLNKVIAYVRNEAQDRRIRAAAVASMAYVTDPDSQQQQLAMVIALHLRAGRCVDYVTPFSKPTSGIVRFGKAFAGKGTTKLF